MQSVQHGASDYPAGLRRPRWQHPWRRDALRDPLVWPRWIEVGNVFLQDTSQLALAYGTRGVYTRHLAPQIPLDERGSQHTPGSGMGLGLRIVASIIQRHAGHIQVISEPSATSF